MFPFSASFTFFFFNDTATTEIYTLSLHDALPISSLDHAVWVHRPFTMDEWLLFDMESPSYAFAARQTAGERDRKSTRLNSSHQIISYAVFCLKKKKKIALPQ